MLTTDEDAWEDCGRCGTCERAKYDETFFSYNRNQKSDLEKATFSSTLNTSDAEPANKIDMEEISDDVSFINPPELIDNFELKKLMNKLIYLLLAIVLYVLLTYVPGLNIITFPIEMLCTFLHEFGHAFFSIISGGTVHSLCINADGSGVTTTSGGSQGLCTIGGYVGKCCIRKYYA